MISLQRNLQYTSSSQAKSYDWYPLLFILVALVDNSCTLPSAGFSKLCPLLMKISFPSNLHKAFISPYVEISTQLTENTKCFTKNYSVHFFWQSLMAKPIQAHLMFIFLLQNTCFCTTHSEWLQLS